MKFDWDGNGFNRFEIRTKTDEQWNLAYTDSEGSMTEEHINKHDFKLKLENTYESKGDVESGLTTTGDVDASGTGSASNKSEEKGTRVVAVCGSILPRPL